jgi:hypothetical protein
MVLGYLDLLYLTYLRSLYMSQIKRDFGYAFSQETEDGSI